MSLLRSLFGPSKAEVWQTLSDQIGANYINDGFWKGDRVEAHVDPWTVVLDTYTVSTGKSSVTYTRLRAPFANRDGLRFQIYRAGLFSQLGKAMGMQDIEIGEPEFDRAFIIKGNHEGQIKALLSNPALRDLLVLQPAISFHIADDEGMFGPHFPEQVDELYFQVVGVIKDIPRLKALFDLFAATLHQLCHIGSAYETDPFLPMVRPAGDVLLRASENAEETPLLRPASGTDDTDAATLPRPAEAPPERTPTS